MLLGLPLFLLTLPAGESPDPALLAIPPAQIAKARDLVRQLGSPAYRDRERADRELARMGRLALPALAAAAATDDTEVCHRVGLLLVRAEADDLRAKIETFLADTTGAYRHDLPGWDTFRAAIGDDPGSRALFTQVVKNPANCDLRLALEAGETDLTRAIADRRQAINLQFGQQLPNGAVVFRGGSPDLPDIGLVFLAESLTPENLLPVGGSYYNPVLFLNLATTRALMTGLNPSPAEAAFRKLVVRWLDTRESPQSTFQALNVAQNLNLTPETITRYAARVLTTEGNASTYKFRAATLLAQYGGKQHLPALTGLFRDDSRLLFAGNGQVEVRVRDFALAMAVLLTGQEPQTYGFGLQPGAPEGLRFSYTYHRFYPDDKQTGDQKRAAAFAKWRDWEAAVYGSAAGAAAVAVGQARRFDAK